MPMLVNAAPADWRLPDGRRILIESPRWSGSEPVEPTFGGFGVDGVYWSHGYLFTDEGVFRRPSAEHFELETR